MAKHLHILRVIGDRTAKIQRYMDRGFYVAVELSEKLPEGRRARLNVLGLYSDFYFAIVENEKARRKVNEVNDYTRRVAQMTDIFTLEVFENSRNKYVRLKKRLIDSIKARELKGIANKCFRNLCDGYLPKSGFSRFSRKAENIK
nr:MAG TPA: hypothetical protein [Caudoviricetes sp.]